jgi:hypothetical protein
MRASFKLVRNSAVRLGALTPSGKSVPLVGRLERNDFVRSSTVWISLSCEENSPSCDMAVGMKVGLVWPRGLAPGLANGGYLRLCEFNKWGVA